MEAEEAEVKSQAAATKEIADDARADLDKALPALNAAVNALSALNKNDITEIKSFAKPPALVQMTMEAVCILNQQKPDWDTAKKMLGDSNFMKSLMEFDKDNIPEAVIKKLKKYTEHADSTRRSWQSSPTPRKACACGAVPWMCTMKLPRWAAAPADSTPCPGPALCLLSLHPAAARPWFSLSLSLSLCLSLSAEPLQTTDKKTNEFPAAPSPCAPPPPPPPLPP